MPGRHLRSFSSSVVASASRKEPVLPSPLDDDYGSRALSGEGAEMDSADRSFLEYGLTAAIQHGTTVLHANASTMTNSDSCHDWTGDLRFSRSLSTRMYVHVAKTVFRQKGIDEISKKISLIHRRGANPCNR